MSLKDIEIKKEYRNLHGNIVKDFYNPLLGEAVLYKRSVGFFSSTALACFSVGLCKFLQNGGKIQLVASPKLSDEDIKAMQDGYEKRKIIENSLLRELHEPNSFLQNDRLNMLANLIAEGRMDIKIAFTESGMYHEKLGVIEDGKKNYVAFSGSLNESENAFKNNYETIDVYCSWNDVENRASDKNIAFENIWNGNDKTLRLFDFPKLKEEIISRYKKSEPKFDMDEKEVVYVIPEPKILEVHDSGRLPNIPIMPDWLNLHDYQKEAIEKWAEQNYRGIFDMATGTGKTLTGLSAMVRLFEKQKNICVIILCPYIHLVTQWIEDIEKFNIKPIIAFGSSPQKDWPEELRKAISKRNFINDDFGFFCLISTIATFKREKIQSQLSKIRKPILLIADEAHNLGTVNMHKYLPDEKINYRLALSATLERHFDESGTQFLYNFFGTKCIEYGLGQAINEGFLTKYDYYPIIVTLDEDERDKYRDYTKSIINEIINDKDTGKSKLSDKGKKLCILRSRIIAGAKSKIPALISALNSFKKENMILIYCGATKYDEDSYSLDDSEYEDIRQIDEVTKQVHNTLGMSISKFTATETPETRKLLIQKFSEGQELQALAAIKCLDEGVNIPSIKTAFILASSTNPKEYIQRRGRVLRLSQNKEKAEIYDFITLPYGLYVSSNKTQEENNMFKSLAQREVIRMKEFSSLSENEHESLPVIENIEKNFGLKNQLYKEEFIDE